MIDQYLQQTAFHIEKLKNVVNVSRSSAYQIFTTPGPSLGRIGVIVHPASQEAANATSYETVRTASATRKGPANWFRQVLASLRKGQ